MPKKKFNWKSREIKHTIVDDSETKKLNVVIHDKGHFDEANQLVLPSKKRNTKVKRQKVETVRILSKKQRKLLEKIVDKKKKKENRQNILDELQIYQLPKEEQIDFDQKY